MSDVYGGTHRYFTNVAATHDVHVTFTLTTPACPLKDVIKKDVEAAVRRAGAQSVNVELSANTRGTPGGDKKNVLPQVKNIVAVGAGKGGVGKSTVAVNLAVGLHRAGARVGLMDGDIYGPSMPTMLGIARESAAVYDASCTASSATVASSSFFSSGKAFSSSADGDGGTAGAGSSLGTSPSGASASSLGGGAQAAAAAARTAGSRAAIVVDVHKVGSVRLVSSAMLVCYY